MKFVLVNGRTTRTRSFCALCCKSIGESYLRDIAARSATAITTRLQSSRSCTAISCDGIMITPPDASKYFPQMGLRPKRRNCESSGCPLLLFHAGRFRNLNG